MFLKNILVFITELQVLYQTMCQATNTISNKYYWRNDVIHTDASAAEIDLGLYALD